MKDEEYKKLIKTDWVEIIGHLAIILVSFVMGFIAGTLLFIIIDFIK